MNAASNSRTVRAPRSKWSRTSSSDERRLVQGGQGRSADDLYDSAAIMVISIASAGLVVVAALALVASAH